jgi:hypothetical protein
MLDDIVLPKTWTNNPPGAVTPLYTQRHRVAADGFCIGSGAPVMSPFPPRPVCLRQRKVLTKRRTSAAYPPDYCRVGRAVTTESQGLSSRFSREAKFKPW